MAKRAQSTQDTAAQSTQDGPASEVMRVELFDEEALRSIVSFDDAAALTAEVHGNIVAAAEELGDGFTLIKDEDKARLVGLPLIFMQWSFHDGDFGSQFVAARVVARNHDGSASKYILNDGSTGICETLKKYTDNTGRTGGLYARHGLRASEYMYCEACQTVAPKVGDEAHRTAGKHKKAATYYIDTSA